jgi:hypothetical protein
LKATGAFAFGLLSLIIFLTQGFGKGSDLWLFVIMILCLGGGVKFFLAYSVAMKKLTAGDASFMKEMIDDEIVAKIPSSPLKINEDILFNWEILTARRDTADLAGRAFLSEIAAPFQAGVNGSFVIDRITDTVYPVIVPGFGSDKKLEKENRELIIQVVENYKKMNEL